MFRLSRPLLAVALFAVASLARASSLQLLAPVNGATLRGGSLAELRWSAAELPAEAEEWEAFLSVDGGKYYAFRVTPHLDAELRRFTFVVPNVATNDARILIRAGNEVRETEFAPRGSFSIVRDAKAELVVPQLLPVGRGEAAREGDPDVLSWAEGARDGYGLTQRSAPALPSASLDRLAAITLDTESALEPAVNRVGAPLLTAKRGPSIGFRVSKAEPPPIALDLLLVCRRRNL